MTKSHFEELAKILGETNATKEQVDRIVTLCADANPRFTPSRFREAVEANRRVPRTVNDVCLAAMEASLAESGRS